MNFVGKVYRNQDPPAADICMYVIRFWVSVLDQTYKTEQLALLEFYCAALPTVSVVGL
jgi:hypothetical protein